MFEDLQPFAVSFFIGLIIGIERERSHPAGLQAMGVRTFVLLALLGTFAAWIKHPIISVLLTVFSFTAILLGYIRTTAHKKIGVGLTTEFAAAAVFCLGYITTQQPLLAAIVGLAVLFVLLGRERLHNFSRQQLKPAEIRAATTVLIIMLGVLPFLPNHTIDTWHLFNPSRFGILVLVIALLQFGGYVAMRMFGERMGLLLTGFFGGLISSTMVFITLPRLTRTRPELTRAATTAALLSIVAKLMEFCVIIFIAAPNLLSHFIWPIFTMVVLSILIAFFSARNDSNGKMMPHTINPLDIRSVLRLTCFIGGMILLIGIAEFYLNNNATTLVAFLGGLVQLQGTTYAVASLSVANKLTLLAASNILAIAILASFVSKFVLLWSLAHNRFALLMSFYMLLILFAGWATYFLVI
jgi:uncharacterized membrane protein (DUF4010 family)